MVKDNFHLKKQREHALLQVTLWLWAAPLRAVPWLRWFPWWTGRPQQPYLLRKLKSLAELEVIDLSSYWSRAEFKWKTQHSYECTFNNSRLKNYFLSLIFKWYFFRTVLLNSVYIFKLPGVLLKKDTNAWVLPQETLISWSGYDLIPFLFLWHGQPPSIYYNGVVGSRASKNSDHSAFTADSIPFYSIYLALHISLSIPEPYFSHLKSGNTNIHLFFECQFACGKSDKIAQIYFGNMF